MKLEFAVLAERVEMQNGKLSILGIFDALAPAKYPIRYTSFYLVMRFLVHRSEFGRKHDVKVQVADEDGKEIFHLSSQVLPDTAAAPHSSTGELPLPFWIEFKKFTFTKPGDYAIYVSINGSYAATVPLALRVST